MAMMKRNISCGAAALLLVALVLSPTLLPAADAAITLSQRASELGVPLSSLQDLARKMSLTDQGLSDFMGTPPTKYFKPAIGGAVISSDYAFFGTIRGGIMVAYYHPSCSHYATTTGAAGIIKTTAGSGVWALSYQRIGDNAFSLTYGKTDTRCT